MIKNCLARFCTLHIRELHSNLSYRMWSEVCEHPTFTPLFGPSSRCCQEDRRIQHFSFPPSTFSVSTDFLMYLLRHTPMVCNLATQLIDLAAKDFSYCTLLHLITSNCFTDIWLRNFKVTWIVLVVSKLLWMRTSAQWLDINVNAWSLFCQSNYSTFRSRSYIIKCSCFWTKHKLVSGEMVAHLIDFSCFLNPSSNCTVSCCQTFGCFQP